jgi:hypothetical protein
MRALQLRFPVVLGKDLPQIGRPLRQGDRRPGVDVMITIFCDFLTIFGGKKLAFFSKTNVMIKFLHNLALF